MAVIRAILWAQWRSLLNFRPGDATGGRVLAIVLLLLWYGLWGSMAAMLGAVVSHPGAVAALEVALPWGLLAVFVYWQLTPILTASLGAFLSLDRLLIYPIPSRQLFDIEVLLRLTTGLEMLLVLAGITGGLLLNPALQRAPVLVAVPLFIAFNLFLAAGLKNLLSRLVAYKRIRELLVLLIVLAAALPQLLVAGGIPRWLRAVFSQAPPGLWPWTATGRLMLGDAAVSNWAALAAWTLAAYVFGRRQFERELHAGAFESTAGPAARGGSRADALFRLPQRLLPDPAAAMVEKELRSYFRSPRFRLVFIMGFTFGFLVWVPFLRTLSRSGAPADFAAYVSGYALLLLSEVALWNVFGFDRSAAQFYFSAPVRFQLVLISKNIATAILILLQVSIILAVCLVVRIPVAFGKAVETYAVMFVFSLYLIASGNLSSVHSPRAVNPEQTWGRGSGGGKFQAMTLLVVPLALPLLLAYGARYAFQSELAFYGVLALVGAIGGIFYWVALDSVTAAAEVKKEGFLAALGRAAGPLSE